MLSPRWRKILRDMWRNKGRTLLVVLSIAVGVFAVGVVANMRSIVQRDMIGSYEAVNPASATIYTEDDFDDDLLDVVRSMPEVSAAGGRRQMVVRFLYHEEEGWYPMLLFAISDYEDMQVSIVQPEIEFGPDPGSWPGPVPLPPPEREMMVERTSLILARTGLLNTKQGDTLLVETPLGKQREVPIAGLVADFSKPPATFTNMSYGYVTFDTMEWLGLPRTYNELLILVAGDRSDQAHIEEVARKVADRVERSGVSVSQTTVSTPGNLPVQPLVDGLSYILSAMGVLSLLSSLFLLINTVQALLSQQVRQIGVMKAIGARGRQILGMYLSIIVIYGILALLLSVPLGVWAARWVVNFMIYFANFNLSAFNLPPQVLALEIGMGLLVPLLAALWPIVSGSRITVREAISDYGLGEAGFGEGFIDRLIESVRGLPRPMLLSLRNTFRRKGRLAMTMITLILAGTIFVAIVSVRASMDLTMDDVFDYYGWDALIQLQRSFRMDRIESVALSVPGVVGVEGWGGTSGYRMRPDGSEGESFPITSLPAATSMLRPRVVRGRWLAPEDTNTIVVNTHFFSDEPDVGLGSEIEIKIMGRETTWRIVGVVEPVQSWPEAFANDAHFARLLHDAGRASTITVVTERHDDAFQNQVTGALEAKLRETGVAVSTAYTVAEFRQLNASLFVILMTFLMSMAVLLAVVGGIGLMGTMLLNVLERVREIGVMRAIGAADGAVLQIFIVEGVIIGLFSCLVATALALPLGRVISNALGEQIVGGPLSYTFSVPGVAIWLGASILISVMASYVPAQNATRLTVREVLSYEG